MLCNKCNKNEATYYVEQNINGKVTKLALCPECAKEYNSSKFNPFVGLNLLGGLFGVPAVKRDMSEKKRCTLCASTFDEIAKSGRVGCAECYKVFADELESSIKRIHGNVKHVGRNPHGDSSAIEDTEAQEAEMDEVAALRNELNEAIAREDYEKAAELRDKIKALNE